MCNIQRAAGPALRRTPRNYRYTMLFSESSMDPDYIRNAFRYSIYRAMQITSPVTNGREFHGAILRENQKLRPLADGLLDPTGDLLFIMSNIGERTQRVLSSGNVECAAHRYFIRIWRQAQVLRELLHSPWLESLASLLCRCRLTFSTELRELILRKARLAKDGF